MRFILTMLLAAFVTTASATEISANVGTRQDTVTKQFSRISEVRLQDDALGVQITTGNVARVEADYAIKVPYVSFLTVAVGAGAVTSGVGHYTYSVEPKVAFAITDKIGAFGSYKYRDAFKNNLIADKTQVVAVGVTYKVTPSIGLLAKVEQSKGDLRYDAGFVGASYSF